MNIFDRVILYLVRRWMNRYVNRIFSVAYEVGTINSKALHSLSSYFDSTQTRLYTEKRSDLLHRRMRARIEETP